MDFSMLDLGNIDHSSDSISGFDSNLNITVWNKTLEKKYGIPASEAIGSNLLELFPHFKDDQRVHCLRESMEVDRNYFFTGLPYVYEDGMYTQLILSFEDNNSNRFAINVVRDHSINEPVLRHDLMGQLIKK